MKTNLQHRSAFTLVEIMIVVAIIGLLASIAIPNFVRARTHAQAVTCNQNLHAIFGVKQLWVTDSRKPGATVPTDDDLFGAGKHMTKKPACPAGGTYTLNAADEVPACSVLGHTY